MGTHGLVIECNK